MMTASIPPTTVLLVLKREMPKLLELKSKKVISMGIILATKQMSTMKFWIARFLPMSIVTRAKRKMTLFLTANKLIILPIITTTMEIQDGVTTLPTSL